MKKSIYYLIANTLTNILVVILLACITETKGYPAINFGLEITQLLDKFAPMAFLLIIEAASIILCAYECTSEKEIPAAINVVAEVVTIASILYSLVAVVWVGQNYAGAGALVKVPFILLGCYAAGLVGIYSAETVSKKNPTLGGLLPLISVLVIIAGFVLDLLIKY